MRDIKRREKLAALLFDLAKYLLTAIAAASLFTKEVITLPTAILSLVLAMALIVIAWFLTPSE